MSLAAINLIASMYNSALPAMCLSRNGGSQTALGAVNTAAGLAMLGGLLVDNVFEPFMCNRAGIFQTLFGSGKGSGAALLFMLMGFAGTLICLIFRHDKYIY